MTAIAVRQSGGANIISIPKAILKSLGLAVGSQLNLTLENNKIVLTPMETEADLEWLLAGTSLEDFRLTEEDKEWLHLAPVGREV